jgi:hypothetical protein
LEPPRRISENASGKSIFESKLVLDFPQAFHSSNRLQKAFQDKVQIRFSSDLQRWKIAEGSQRSFGQKLA